MIKFCSHYSRMLLAGFLCLFISTMVSAAGADELIKQAQSNLQSGDADAAYQLLKAGQVDHAGNVEFDYWLGLSAMRAGKPEESVFALERVLEQEPNHAGARMELATAYIKLDQRKLAEKEIETLEASNPPPEAQKRIEELKAALVQREEAEASKNRQIFITLEAGHDDNVGTWPEFDIVPGVPVKAVDSAFQSIQGGIWQRFQMDESQNLDVTFMASLRDNEKEDAEQFDQDYYMLKGEWNRDLDGKNQVAAGLQHYILDLDGEDFFTATGGYGEWTQRVDATSERKVRLGYRHIDYDIDIYDYRLTRFMVGNSKTLSNGRMKLNVDVNADYDEAIDDRVGGDSVALGLNATLYRVLSSSQRVIGSASYSRVDYRSEIGIGEAANLEPEMRKDNRFSTSISWEWKPVKPVLVRVRASYREQDSSLDLYSYDQMLGSLALTYNF